LFAKVLGEEVVARERDTLLELGELLGYLPLAIDIVACRLAYESGWSADALLGQLRRERTRLNGLVYAGRGVRLAFEAAFAALSPVQQRLFAALSAFGGADFTIEAAAAVAGIPPCETECNLRELLGCRSSIVVIQDSTA
jgi:hypothetical protein